MKYGIKFFPERRKYKNNEMPGQIIEKNIPVLMSVTFAGQRMFYFTGQRCDLKQWDEGSQRLKRNNIAPNGISAPVFNNDLDELKVVVDNIFKSYDVSGIIPTIAQLRIEIEEKKKPKRVNDCIEVRQKSFFDYFDTYIKDAIVSEERRKHLRTTYNKVEKFNPFTTFEIVTPEFLNRLQNYLQKDHNLSKNTTISELKRFRAFLSYSVRNGWTAKNPFKSFKIDPESYGDPVYITIEERDMLFNAEIESKKLAKVRDMFVLQCFIGCRVGDFVQMKRTNIIDGCIEYIAAKTKDEKPRIARVPLTPKALEIINRYDLPDGKLLPFMSFEKYNEYIKDLFRLVKLTRLVTIADKKTRANIVVPISDLASSHMARRVFVGNLHSKVKNEVIASMSGHAENSRAFSRYYTIDKADQVEAIKLIE